MKIKPIQNKRGTIFELGPNEAQLPAETFFQLDVILVPVDLSVCSRKALAYAIPFAKQFEAEIVLLHVVPSFDPVAGTSDADSAALVAQMLEAGKRELDKMRMAIPENLSIKTLLRSGHPAQEIVAAAAEVDADLILLSTPGRTGLGRVFFGSVAEHVTRYARCPVLTVREREHEFVNASTTRSGAKAVRRTAQSLTA